MVGNGRTYTSSRPKGVDSDYAVVRRHGSGVSLRNSKFSTGRGPPVSRLHADMPGYFAARRTCISRAVSIRWFSLDGVSLALVVGLFDIMVVIPDKQQCSTTPGTWEEWQQLMERKVWLKRDEGGSDSEVVGVVLFGKQCDLAPAILGQVRREVIGHSVSP